MQNQRRTQRLMNEMKQWNKSPPVGISCWKENDIDSDWTSLEANVIGPENTPYQDGIFHLDIHIPESYPIDPPQVSFKTKVYHPNIDSEGRICLDTLKKPPNGSWKPIFNLYSVLTSVRELLKFPNPDDPLDTDIAQEYRLYRERFEQKAKDWTNNFASQSLKKNSSEIMGSKN